MNRSPSPLRLLAALLLPFALAACGNRGDLYLPPDEKAPAPQDEAPAAPTEPPLSDA